MAKESSFDIVSVVNMQEVANAVNQACKEVENRFDFKNSYSEIRLEKDQIILVAQDEYKLAALLDVLQSKLVRREVSLKALKPGRVEPAAHGRVRQTFTLQQGIDQDVAKKITRLIKDSKLKVQATIQGDQIRVSGKSKDDLQAVIQMVRGADLPIPVQFVNYR